MSINSLILAVLAAVTFRVSDLGAQEQLRGNDQLRGAVPSQRPIETGSTGLSPQQIYQQSGPAVVLLICAGSSGAGELGTGSIIDKAGHIITNAHVVIDKSSGQPYQQIHVYFKPRHLTGDPNKDAANPSDATVVKWDSAMDLAVLSLNKPPAGGRVIAFGDSDALDAGEPVVAIGRLAAVAGPPLRSRRLDNRRDPEPPGRPGRSRGARPQRSRRERRPPPPAQAPPPRLDLGLPHQMNRQGLASFCHSLMTTLAGFPRTGTFG